MYREIHYNATYFKFNTMNFRKLYVDSMNLIFFLNEPLLVSTRLISV